MRIGTLLSFIKLKIYNLFPVILEVFKIKKN